MRKVTIIIIAAIFVASIVIVGQFGLETPIVDEFKFIDKIIFTTINGVEVQSIGDEKDTKYVILPYERNLVVVITFEVEPADADEAKNVLVEVSSPEDYSETATLTFETGAGWQLNFLKPGTVTVKVTSPDEHLVSKELMVIVQ